MSNEKKLTAVDIAFEKLANSGLLVTRDYKNIVAYREAKKIEKEQMIDFGCYLTPESKKDIEIEYNEIYGGNK